MNRNSFRGPSVIWKALVREFPVVGKWLAWKVVKENKSRIGEYPLIGCTS
jgi:hypothetical protein